MIKLLLLNGLVAVSLIACNFRQSNISPSGSDSSPSSNCQMIQHAGGETQVCGTPRRIAVLNPKMLDLVLLLDVQPIGYAEVFSNHKGDFDQPAQQIPYLGSRITQPIANLGISGEPSLEAISRLQPDLILGDSAGNQEEYAQLAQIAPTLLFDYVGHNKWQEPLQTIAKVLERSEQAQAVIETQRQQIETARQALSPVVNAHPTVLMLASEQLTPPVDVITPVDFCGGLLKELGFQLISPSKDEPNDISQTISLEVLSQLNADLIIMQGYNIAELSQIKNVNNFENGQLRSIQQAWKANPIAQSLTASRENRVYFISTYLCRGIPSPTGTQLALEQLQTQLSPLTVEVNQQ
jgi:iron complex transport system substrate-binding protein